ncbi:MAG: N-methyl-D-aspartate receptor NMDAR2C subunit [Polaromonas sp.]|nr:N-methyl-D-aspartate receptor NMDAR2C subunit [Polaromonas sp.]
MTKLEKSWKQAWRNLGLQPREGLLERLINAWSEPHRRYHTVQHLSECLAHFESVDSLAVNPGDVEFALWFHDAIYDLKAKDNELRSAEWAVDELTHAGAGSEQLRRVRGLIMVTCHTAIPTDPDQQLLVDIDLSILGAGPARFVEYDAQIQAEYSWVPDLIYRAKRKEVLAGFLDRAVIYNTGHLRARLERQARENLQAAIS